MNKYNLVELIDLYLSKKTISMDSKSKKSIIKFFEKIKEEADKAGLIEVKNNNDSLELTGIVDDIISKARKSKTEKAKMYNDFVSEFSESPRYLGYLAPLQKIEIPLTTLERRLDIIKNYGNKRKQTNKSLAEKYDVDPKIISADLSEIQAGELNVYGQEFLLDALVDTGKDDIKSTVVPIVLASNIIEVIALLEGLNKAKSNRFFCENAEHIATGVWMQLSDEVKDKC